MNSNRPHVILFMMHNICAAASPGAGVSAEKWLLTIKRKLWSDDIKVMFSSKRFEACFYCQFFLCVRNHLTQEDANKQRKLNSNASADYHSIQLTAVVQWKWLASSWKSILATFYALTGYRLEIWTCHNTCEFNILSSCAAMIA